MIWEKRIQFILNIFLTPSIKSKKKLNFNIILNHVGYLCGLRGRFRAGNMG